MRPATGRCIAPWRKDEDVRCRCRLRGVRGPINPTQRRGCARSSNLQRTRHQPLLSIRSPFLHSLTPMHRFLGSSISDCPQYAQTWAKPRVQSPRQSVQSIFPQPGERSTGGLPVDGLSPRLTRGAAWKPSRTGHAPERSPAQDPGNSRRSTSSVELSLFNLSSSLPVCPSGATRTHNAHSAGTQSAAGSLPCPGTGSTLWAGPPPSPRPPPCREIYHLLTRAGNRAAARSAGSLLVGPRGR